MWWAAGAGRCLIRGTCLGRERMVWPTRMRPARAWRSTPRWRSLERTAKRSAPLLNNVDRVSRVAGSMEQQFAIQDCNTGGCAESAITRKLMRGNVACRRRRTQSNTAGWHRYTDRLFGNRRIRGARQRAFSLVPELSAGAVLLLDGIGTGADLPFVPMAARPLGVDPVEAQAPEAPPRRPTRPGRGQSVRGSSSTE